MNLHYYNGLKYYSFKSFDLHNIKHAIFTRQGGVSDVPFSSLNLGGTVGDNRKNVIENRRRIFNALNLPLASLYDAWQVHGTHVISVQAPRPHDAPHEKADILLTDKQGITLLMRFADCVPVFLFDPIKKVIGLVHAGWAGTVKKAVAVAVEAMKNEYDVHPSNVLAGIGPSIGPDHYEIGQEVAAKVKVNFGSQASQLLENSNGRIYLDLWKTNAITLQNCGVEKIEIAHLCTACNFTDWFSHRAEKGRTGRFAATITL